MLAHQTNLLLEAGYFCRKIFGRPVPEEVAERYAKAWRFCFPHSDPIVQAKLDLIVAYRLDVEAIEIALRHQQPDNVLTKKIQILFYLLEVRSDFLPFFVNFENRVPYASAHLIWTLFYSAWKILKGRILVWRYDLL